MTKPKNALTKQYEKILSLDGVELTFTEDALEEIADEALQRKTGARGLRAIIEKVMKRVMFEVPSMPEVTKCIVNRESVLSTGEPILKNEGRPRQSRLNRKFEETHFCVGMSFFS